MSFSTRPLGEVARLLSGGTPRKSNPAYWQGPIPWLTPKDMGRWENQTEAHVSEQAIGNGTRLAPANASFIAVRGMSLHNEIRVISCSRSITFNQDIKAVVAGPDLDDGFLYYALTAAKPTLLNSVSAAGHGTGVLATDRLLALPIPAVPVQTQRAIAKFFGDIDDKIELNRQMNETLEAQARALFRDWFVEFGPVEAKMAGDAPYLAPDLWSLFPNRLADDGIPEGWRTYRLDEMADHHTKSLKPMDAASEVFEHFSLPAYDSGQQPVLEVGGGIKSNKTIVPNGAILLSKLNPEIPRVWWPQDKGAHRQIASTEFLAFTAKSGISPALLYSLFSDQTFRQRLEGMVTGTSKSHQRVSPPALRSLEVLAGDAQVFTAFGQIVTSLMQKVLVNRAENHTLAQTRDLLLPKLMSGEIGVREYG